MTFIENESAYEAGKQRNIQFNRIKGNKNRWLQESGQEIVNRVENFLFQSGEFAPAEIVDRQGYHELQTHPVVKASFGDFRAKMVDSLMRWGRLSPAQEKAVLGMIEKGQSRIAEREAAKAVKATTAKHVGTVGERRDFEVTVQFKTSFETQFGWTAVYVCEDDDGNVIVYKGSSVLYGAPDNCGAAAAIKGERIKFKATIKEHGVRDGIAQTIVARPKQ